MRNKLLPTVLMFFLFTTTSFGAIAEHILYVQLAQYWGYGNAASPNLQYSFAFTVEADNTVEHIEFLTPGGTEVVITESQYSDEYGDWWKFRYSHVVTDPADLSEYGDGIYQMTVYYYDEDPDQTLIEYAGLQQPTQQPIPVFPQPNQNVNSPVTFEWEQCTDTAADYIWFDILDLEGNEVIDTIDQPTDATSTDSIELDLGSYVANIGFEHDQSYVNSDGIWITRWKTSDIEWDFTIIPAVDTIDIDLLGISATKQFRDGVPQGDLPWSLDITVRMADSDNLHHIDVTKPEASEPFVTLYEEAGSPSMWGCSLDDDYATLTDLRDVYKDGPYKFEFYTIDNTVIRSLDIDYTNLPGEPDEPVEFTYPTTNGQTGISINPTFTWSVSPDAGDALMTVIDNDEIFYFDAPVPTSSTSWAPGDLVADHQYELDVFVINIKDWAGGPGFPTMTDSTGDTFSYAHTIEYLNEIEFTTQLLNDPTEEIEEILDFIDESVRDKTLAGDGPGKSAENRLNALINMLEEAQRLIEAGMFEDACDQLRAAYRKCDGEARPPDFVKGIAADDLAVMILIVMDNLGC